ncbi:hypothetical protein PRIO_3472 [Paenibacillus riograndensis SBR5]|uniref:Uncharacterized protein n=1 Tax=Paenibacillus riograndensis SBR5 TaxID=1073571 RepID=A0A0E4HAJ4_9BACL|nr:hypothetical protein PRIO_3472 [Paenibacillus riograndensis SBR5]
MTLLIVLVHIKPQHKLMNFTLHEISRRNSAVLDTRYALEDSLKGLRTDYFNLPNEHRIIREYR